MSFRDTRDAMKFAFYKSARIWPIGLSVGPVYNWGPLDGTDPNSNQQIEISYEVEGSSRRALRPVRGTETPAQLVVLAEEMGIDVAAEINAVADRVLQIGTAL